MAFENLSEREKQVLYNLINHYVASADPVGSRLIANKFDMGLSPATIRNTLKDLEEMGLLQQPHTSAGRIPTDLGYRVYVDSLLRPEVLSNEEKLLIKDGVLREGRGIKEILGQTCKVLSDITRQLGVSIAPRFESGVLQRIDLIPVAEGRIMAVVVVRAGLARSVILEIEAAISEPALREVEQALNERLSGLSLGEIRDSIGKRLSEVSGSGRLIKLLVDSKDRIWSESHEDDISVSGADRLVLQPEFADLERLPEFLKLLEDRKILYEFLGSEENEGLVIAIGQENRFKEIINCSLVTSTYSVGRIKGTVGVIGPTRMPYNKLMSVVEYTARTITEALSGVDKRTEEESDS